MSNHRCHSWQPALENDLAATAVAVARDVIARLRDPDQVDAAARVALKQTAFPHITHWQPHAVAQGYAGLAIMCGYLDQCFPDEAWDVAGHTYLILAGRGAEAAPYLQPGLWAGLSGLAFAAWYLSRNGMRYHKLLAALEETLLPDVIVLAEDLERQPSGISVSTFDIISGLSGMGAYLLCRTHNALASAVLETVLRAIVDLSGDEDGLPGWYTPAHLLGDTTLLQAYPHGNLNCGLAHGVPGPLAFLSLAHTHGYAVPGLPEAIDRLAGWLMENRCDDAWGINWSTAVALECDDSLPKPTLKPGAAATAPYGPSRAAWCYGSPGVARALWLAGTALDQARYHDMAIAAMQAVYRRPLAERYIDSPTFCHGIAGLLQITLRFAYDTGLPIFHEAAQMLTEQLLALFKPTTLLGYYNLEFDNRQVDQPGFLDGAPGVALVLLAAAMDRTPSWDRLFLLA